MENVIRAFKDRTPEKKIIVLRLELDYYLMELWDAIENGHSWKVALLKVRLDEIRQQLLELEAF
ncbi:hypothetical protein [Salinithrix halophila]|uniref:Uncharacterized protein n=1 Tax=Salinithrix halophila TaxID=1485204 RepID=A0ABV8JF31_9BACL